MGQIIAELLSREANSIPVIAGRDEGKARKFAENLGSKAEWRRIDAASQESVRAGLEGIDIVISCIGPFMDASLTVPETAIEMKVTYIDVSANHDYFRRLLSLDSKARKANVLLIPSLGINPGISGIILSDSTRHLDNIESADAYFVTTLPGRNTSIGSGKELLSMMAAEPLVWDDEWIKPKERSRKVYFSEPFARELTVYPWWTPDLHGLPEITRAKHIATWANFESNLQGLLFWAGAALGCHKSDRRMVWFLRLLNCLSPFYKDSNKGATIKVAAIGEKDGQKHRWLLELHASDEFVATAIPPVIAISMILNGDIEGCGVLTPGQIIPGEKFLEALKKYSLDYSDKIEPI